MASPDVTDRRRVVTAVLHKSLPCGVPDLSLPLPHRLVPANCPPLPCLKDAALNLRHTVSVDHGRTGASTQRGLHSGVVVWTLVIPLFMVPVQVSPLIYPFPACFALQPQSAMADRTCAAANLGYGDTLWSMVVRRFRTALLWLWPRILVLETLELHDGSSCFGVGWLACTLTVVLPTPRYSSDRFWHSFR